MTDTHGVLLHDVRLGKNVSALLTERVSGAYVLKADETWEAYRQAAKAVALKDGKAYAEPKYDWNWSFKHKKARNLLPYCMFGIECNDDIQGLMLTMSDKYLCRLPDQKDKALVYVSFLETAPWNDVHLANTRRFKGVGPVMLAAAIAYSRELGFKGRIGLHSLDSSETFYEGHGMACLGADHKCNGFKYYEGTPAWAGKFCG